MSERGEPRVRGRITRYGFQWGPATVSRSWSDKGHVGLMIHTGKQVLDIRVTPSGLIRIGKIEKDWHHD